jgi:hypothetical protein
MNPVQISGGSIVTPVAPSTLVEAGESLGEELITAALADVEAVAIGGPIDNKIPVPDINQKISGTFNVPITNKVYDYTLEFDGKDLIFKAQPQS